MVEISKIEERGLGDIILDDYVAGETIYAIAKKHSLGWNNVAYFLKREEVDETDRWRRAIDRKGIHVFQQFVGVKNHLDDLLREYQRLKRTAGDIRDPLQHRNLLVFNKEIRETLKLIVDVSHTYAEVMSKIVTRQDEQDAKRAMIEAIKEADPETGAKVLSKMREYKERRSVLRLKD